MTSYHDYPLRFLHFAAEYFFFFLYNTASNVSAALRVGEPAQEFLKFLAERAPFQAVIWGSDENLPENFQLKRGHWLVKVLGALECPLLSVSSREKTNPLENRNAFKE
jgi:hypothetical protein